MLNNKSETTKMLIGHSLRRLPKFTVRLSLRSLSEYVQAQSAQTPVPERCVHGFHTPAKIQSIESLPLRVRLAADNTPPLH